MPLPTGAPKVTLLEKDLSTRVGASFGSYCAMVIPAPRGPMDTAVLVTTEFQLLDTFTPDGTLLPTYDTSFYEARETLRNCNKLWVSRAAQNPLRGGAFVRVTGATGPKSAVTERGFETPTRYSLATTDGRFDPGPMLFTVDTGAGELTVSGGVYAAITTGDVVRVTTTGTVPAPLALVTDYYAIKSPTTNKIQLASTLLNASQGNAITITSVGTGTQTVTKTSGGTNSVYTVDVAPDVVTLTSSNYDLVQTGDAVTVLSSGGTLPVGLAAATTYYIIKTGLPNKVKLATTLSNSTATPAVPIDLTDVGTGSLTMSFASITLVTSGQEKALLIYGADGGAYNNNISFTLTNYATNPSKVKEPNAFLLEVYYAGLALPREKWLCSFSPVAKDFRNQSLYVADVLRQSQYIRGTTNALLANNTTVADVLTPQALGNGSDGNAVTDSTMTAALNRMGAVDKYPIVFVSDSGWTTPAYQQAVIAFAEQRGACMALLSTPYSTEASSNYLTDIQQYATVTLNSASSHAGIFTPHVKVVDQFNNRELWISASGSTMGEYSDKYERFNPGQPVGGKFAQLNVVDVLRRFTDGEMDYLYDNNINPIRAKAGYGVQIWGQKTLQRRPSDLDRINARMVLISIEPPLKAAYEDFLFTINSLTNDTGTRRQIKLITDNYMSLVRGRGGVYDWRCIVDETNNTLADVQANTLNVWLLVKITKAVEYIPFTIGVTPLTVTFDVAASLLV